MQLKPEAGVTNSSLLLSAAHCIFSSRQVGLSELTLLKQSSWKKAGIGSMALHTYT